MNYHVSVLSKEVLSFASKYISAQEKCLIVDATLGDAGHSLLLLNAFPEASLLGIDRDSQLLSRAKNRLESSTKSIDKSRVSIYHTSYHKLDEILKKQNVRPKFILLDLGVSSFHFKEAARGFSYLDHSLDMRFDPSIDTTAKDIINHASQKELEKILREFGEEAFAHRISKRIVKERPYNSALALAESIRKAIPYQKYGKIHPATRSFQAIRIAVNQELAILEHALEHLPPLLAKGGLIAIIAFHSLEDRIVKQKFKELGVPVNNKKAKDAPFVILTPKPVMPSTEEIKSNPAARSARLRVLIAQRGT